MVHTLNSSLVSNGMTLFRVSKVNITLPGVALKTGNSVPKTVAAFSPALTFSASVFRLTGVEDTIGNITYTHVHTVLAVKLIATRAMTYNKTQVQPL